MNLASKKFPPMLALLIIAFCTNEIIDASETAITHIYIPTNTLVTLRVIP